MPSKDRGARLSSQKKYDEAHRDNYKTYLVKCNKATEADIIDRLDAVDNKQGYIKDLIRKDIRSDR